MFIPGSLISLATFPGVIAHEYAHARACRKRGLRITDITWFQLGNPAGYVKHEQPRRYSDAFWVSVAPFVFNTFAAVLVTVLAASLYATADVTGVEAAMYPGAVAGWVAVSLAWHAIPSKHDAQNVWQHAKREWRTSWFARLGFPLVVVLYVCHYLSYVWFDAVYAILVVAGTVLLLTAGVDALAVAW